MKKLVFAGMLLSIALFFMHEPLRAQVPVKFNYQAIARGTEGTPLINEALNVRIGILSDTLSPVLLWEEEHAVITNSFGLFTLQVGDASATPTGGLESSFAGIDWSVSPKYLQLKIWHESSWLHLGYTSLLSVPYALFSADTNEVISSLNLEGRSLRITEAGRLHSLDLGSLLPLPQTLSLQGADLTISGGNTLSLSGFLDNTDAQNLSLSGSSLNISGGTGVDLSSLSGSSPWSLNDTNLYRSEGTVGIGTSDTEGTKLAVVGDDDTADEPLFEVKRKDGQTVFAVYNTGVRIFVPEDTIASKGRKGGFAIGGFSDAKDFTREYVRITPDSIRFWVKSNPDIKGRKGGFAIGGFTDAKDGLTQEYFRLTHDSARLYINDEVNPTKGLKGGFAIGGFSSAKTGHGGEFLRVTDDSVRVYIKDEDGTKGRKGGFAIGGFSDAKTDHPGEYLRITDDSVRVYIKEDTESKGRKGGFAIGGFSDAKAGEIRLMEVDFRETQIFVNDSSKGFNVSTLEGGESQRFMDIKKTNYFIGHESGINTEPSQFSDLGKYNSFIGYRSGQSNTTGKKNVFIGHMSGRANLSADDNVFIGTESGMNNELGGHNTFLGTYTGKSNVGGTHNTLLGYSAGSAVTGSSNTIVGSNSGLLNTGDNNVFIGASAAFWNQTGSNNVIIGQNAANSYSATAGSNNVFIGYEAGQNEGGSGLLYIANSDDSTPLIYGNFATDYMRIYGNLQATSISKSSDIRLKKDIETLERSRDKLLQIRPVSFYWDTENYPDYSFSSQKQYGFIAQEMETIFPNLVTTDNDGFKGITYIKLIPFMVKVIQEQQAQLDSQAKTIEQLSQDMAAMKAQLESLLQK